MAIGWKPPASYHQVKSALEGITVFAPQPEAAPPELIKSFQCPNCGATTRYDVTAGGVACEHCSYRVSPPAEQVGKRAQEFEFTVETWTQAEKGWGIPRRELHCDACGTSLTVSESSLTTSCSFCGSNKVNLREAPLDALRPRFLIPFKIQSETNHPKVAEWLGKGWFHPGELAKSVDVERFGGIYLPYWTFDTRITANWKAEVGYERQERYYDAGSKDWKTRTVIDWRWESGRVVLDIDDLLVSGSSHISRLLLEKLQPFNLNDLIAYSPDFLAGWQAQAYEVTLPEAWEQGKNDLRERARRACYADIASSHVRNFSMVADFANETWRYILLPIYLAAYKFQEKVYQVMVNGQTGVIAGQKPVAWWKIWLAIAALLLPGLGLGLIGLPLLLAGGIGMLILIIAFVLLLIGGALSVRLYRQAFASEAA